MDKIIQFLMEHIGPKFLVGLAITSAVATSGMTGAKIVSGMNDSSSFQEIPEVQVDNEITNPLGDTGPEGADDDSPTVTPKPGSSSRPLVFSRLLPTSFPIAPTPIPTIAQAVNANACIVTLYGIQYDVAKLRQSHSGGDIFVCNTDMSNVYQNKHGTNVSRMQAYVLGSGSTGGSTTGGTGRSFSNSDYEDEDDMSEEDDDDEDEDEDEQDSESQDSDEEHEEDD